MNNQRFLLLKAATLGLELNCQPLKKCTAFVAELNIYLDIQLSKEQRKKLSNAIRNRCGRGNNNFDHVKELYSTVLSLVNE